MFLRMTLLAITVGLVGCRTIPDDAPEAFLEAQESLQELAANHVDRTMPYTVERANEQFDFALSEYKEAVDNGEIQRRQYAEETAIETRNMAEDALEIHLAINEWDKSTDSMQDALAALNAGPTGLAVIEPFSPFAKLRNSEIISTVAFFETDEAKNPLMNAKELQSLVEVLRKDANFRVVLTGHTDYRGPPEYNKNLALERARTIAEELMKRDVMKSQVTIQGAGESSSEFTSGEIAKLQLDRKVVAILILQ